MNYFQFYGFEPAFELDETQLRALYLQKSKDYHPDFFSQASSEAQAEALRLSVLNNQAYQTLRNAEKRWAYLLELKGIRLQSKPDAMPAEFLMEMMELNEELDLLKNDFSTPKAEKLRNELKTKQEQQLQGLKPLLEAYDQGQQGEEILKKIDFFLKKMRFLLHSQKTLSTFAALNE